MASDDIDVVPITGDMIRLGQFLKFANFAESGAAAGAMIQGGDVKVDGEVETHVSLDPVAERLRRIDRLPVRLQDRRGRGGGLRGRIGGCLSAGPRGCQEKEGSEACNGVFPCDHRSSCTRWDPR